MRELTRTSALLIFSFLSPSVGAQLILTEGTNIAVDVSAANGWIATDLLGSLWIVPADGGSATRISHSALPARYPRWSPDGSRLVFQADARQQTQIQMIDVATGETEILSTAQFVDQQPAWHPSGERIVFSSERGDTGFDLWELDLETRISWRITSQPGDETAPAWSGNGRHLAYIHRHGGRWALVIRRFGEPDKILVESADPLFAPSWRPDGSLLTYLQQSSDGIVVQMVILSDPPLVRPLLSGEDFFVSPLSWIDRNRFFYSASGGIRTRRFDDRHSSWIHFTAAIEKPDRQSASSTPGRNLPIQTPADERFVIRAARLFDGSGYDYRVAADVLIEGGRISAIEPRREWPDAVVLDLGEATMLPGFIDSYAALPAGSPSAIGAELLAYGVTSIVTSDRPDIDPRLWESADSPGPRLLRAEAASETPGEAPGAGIVLATLPASGSSQAELRAWQSLGIPVLAESWKTGLGLGADLLMGADSLPASPRGVQYQDIQVALGAGPITLLSGLADAATPGLAELLESRQASAFGTSSLAVRRHAPSTDGLLGRQAAVVLGSKPSGLPPGFALHAELRALQAAGLGGDQVLKSAGLNAATVLRLDSQVGLIAPGAVADLVLVSGDPLNRAADAINVVAVVRNGRFYSLGGLLERADAARDVE